MLLTTLLSLPNVAEQLNARSVLILPTTTRHPDHFLLTAMTSMHESSITGRKHLPAAPHALYRCLALLIGRIAHVLTSPTPRPDGTPI